jgi:hypothetical protein
MEGWKIGKVEDWKDGSGLQSGKLEMFFGQHAELV